MEITIGAETTATTTCGNVGLESRQTFRVWVGLPRHYLRFESKCVGFHVSRAAAYELDHLPSPLDSCPPLDSKVGVQMANLESRIKDQTTAD
jgi:hypothetical protein